MIRWFGRERQRELDEKLYSRMHLATRFVLDEAKRRVPVDTSKLKNSIAMEVERENDSIIGRVGSNVDYAIHVEYGAEMGKSPRGDGEMPWLRPALYNNITQIKKFINDIR